MPILLFCVLHKIDHVRGDKDSLLHNYRSVKLEVTRAWNSLKETEHLQDTFHLGRISVVCPLCELR